MPGIYGVIGATPEAELPALMAEMARRLKHHPWYVDHRHLDPPAGVALGRMSLGLVNTAEQPASNEDRSLLGVMEGEVYDYQEQRRALTAAGHQFRNDSHAELLLHGYEAGGEKFFRGLQGMFAAAIWDVRCRRLILTNDRFGMKPLYFVQLPDRSGRLLFASEIKALLADPGVSRQVNWRGIAQFFTFGQLLGEDTLLESVRLLPPAGWLCYDARQGRLELDRYWRLEAVSNSAGTREGQVLDRLDEAFKAAVDRRTAGPNRLGLSLSGGLDSRTILAAVNRDQVPITSVSIGVEGGIDHRCAQQMAALANRRHHCHVLDGQFLARFEEHLQRMVYLTDGHYLSQCIVMPTLPVYRELGIEVLLRGHAGELMHMDKAYNFSLDRQALVLRDEAGLEDWLCRRLHAFMLAADRPLFAAPPGEIESLARESLRSCLRESEGIGPPAHRVWHLFLSQRLRRETALSLVKFGSLVETRLPYLDNDLVDLLLAAPLELKLGDKIQAHILRRRLPAFLKVVNANTGTRLGAGRLARFFATARLKVLRKLGFRGYQHYEKLGLWLRRELRPLVNRLLLSERCLDRGILDPFAVKAVVQKHLASRENQTFLLMALMIFELGQREFLDRDGLTRTGATGGEILAPRGG